MTEGLIGDVLSSAQVNEYKRVLSDYLINEPTLANQIYSFFVEGQSVAEIRARLDELGLGASASRLKGSIQIFNETMSEG